MSIITRYLNRHVLIRLLVVLFAGVGFALLFDLLDVGSRVIRRSDLPDALALARYALIRLPTLVSELLPLVTLIASLIAVLDLLRRRELIVMWGAGVSRMGMILRLWPLALVLIAGKFLIDDLAVPMSAPELRELRIGEFRLDERPGDGTIWFRGGEDILRLPAISAVNGELKNILILDLDENGQLVQRVEARRAAEMPEGWLLQDVLIRPAAAESSRTEDELLWPVVVDLERVSVMAKMPRELSWMQLLEVVVAEGWGITAIDGHATWLHGRVADALSPALMLLLGFAVARRYARMGTMMPVFAAGLALGFTFTIGHGLMLAFGDVGIIEPVIAAWTAPLVLAVTILLFADIGVFRRPIEVMPDLPRQPGS